MIASAQTLRQLKPVEPFVERTVQDGMSYGLSYAGYDIRIDGRYILLPGEFTIANSLEKFSMPNNYLGVVHDKSTWARQGLAVQNTILEPGWNGYLTLELTNHSKETIYFPQDCPIAQIVFHQIDEEIGNPYKGKYQNQERKPIAALFERND